MNTLTPEKLEELKKQGLTRYRYSKNFHASFRQRWVRYYKIWRSIKDVIDDIEDSDEPNDFVPYAFGLIEDMTAKVCEPLYKMRPPCKPTPKRPQDAPAADRFGAYCRNYFQSAAYQSDYGRSCKEEFIIGVSWEMDTYSQRYAKGRRRMKVEKTAAAEEVTAPDGRQLAKLEGGVPTPYTTYETQEHQYPVKVGYNTVFPPAFHVHPEPNVKKHQDLHWLCHEEPTVALEDLKQEMETDPNDPTKKVPLYDFTELLKLYGETHKPGEIQAQDPCDGDDYYKQVVEAVAGKLELGSGGGEAVTGDGVDRVHLIHVWEPTRVYTIASCIKGQFVIRVKDNPFDRPGIPFRLRTYTPDPYLLYGMGAIEPIEDMVGSLNDIHNLSLANWIRIINKMIAIETGALENVEDLESRSGGYIRFKGLGGNVHNAIAAVEHTDVTPSMIAQASNVKGIIETASGRSDLAPGVLGTKQDHETATGVLEIQRNMAARSGMIMRQHLICYHEQMSAMESILSQFQFDPVNVKLYHDDGSSIIVEVTNDTLYTEGRGFDFDIEQDSAYGDDSLAVAQLGQILEMGLRIEEWRAKLGSQEDPRVNIIELYRRVLQRRGITDTSKILQAPGGSIDSGREFDIIMSGGKAEIHEGDDHLKHALDHMIQERSPVLQQALAAGKIQPEVVRELQRHAQLHLKAAAAVLKDPLGAAQAKLGQAMRSAPKEAAPAGGASVPA